MSQLASCPFEKNRTQICQLLAGKDPLRGFRHARIGETSGVLGTVPGSRSRRGGDVDRREIQGINLAARRRSGHAHPVDRARVVVGVAVGT